MNTKTKIAFGCYFTAIFAQAAAGVVYLSRDAFMPYHAVAVGMSWQEVPASLQLLILTVPFVLLTNYAAMSYAMALVDMNTPAEPPWAFVICGVFLTVTACVLSFKKRKAWFRSSLRSE